MDLSRDGKLHWNEFSHALTRKDLSPVATKRIPKMNSSLPPHPGLKEISIPYYCVPQNCYRQSFYL
eukprot:3861511-Amphidinium_carterae.1